MLRQMSIILAAAAPFVMSTAATAQQRAVQAVAEVQTIKRTPLQRFEVPGTEYETIIGIAEIVPNVNVGRHTHPGPESGYVIQGGFELLVEGKAPGMLSAGDSYLVPAGVPHDALTGHDGAKVIAAYLIPAGKPLATPVD